MDAAVETDFDVKNDEMILQAMLHLDELLREESLPPCPFLPHEYNDLASVDEIRRTLVVANIDESVSGQELLDFFGNAGEVKYIKFCMRKNDPLRYCMVEFSSLMSIINGLKLNNHTLHGRMIKVYHSVEAIEKPSYIQDPESFMQCLLELKSHVEDSLRVVKRAAKDVCEYEDYCNDNQPPSKSPLKNTETAIAEIEEALSKVLSAQSLISVVISPVESELLSIIGETVGDREPVPTSPESFLKFVRQKRPNTGKEELESCHKKDSSKISKLESRNLHRRHRTRSGSKERKNKYHSHSVSGTGEKSAHHREESSRSHDSRSRKHDRHSSLHCPSVLSSVDGEENSGAYESKEDELIDREVDGETNQASQCKITVAVKSLHEELRNESEKENDDQEKTSLVSNLKVQTSAHSPENTKKCVKKDLKEDSSRKIRRQSPSREHLSQSDRSRSKSYGGRRSSLQGEYRKSPTLSSKNRSPPSSEKGRKGGLRRRGSRSPSLDHYRRHHHHHHRSSWSWHAGPSDHTSRLSAHRERWRRAELRDIRHSSCHTPKSHHRSPRHHHSSISSRHHSSKGSHREKSPGKRSHRHSDIAVVKVYPESYEEYLEESDVEVEGEETLPSLESDDRSKTETASGGSSQNYSLSGLECEDKEAGDSE